MDERTPCDEEEHPGECIADAIALVHRRSGGGLRFCGLGHIAVADDAGTWLCCCLSLAPGSADADGGGGCGVRFRGVADQFRTNCLSRCYLGRSATDLGVDTVGGSWHELQLQFALGRETSRVGRTGGCSRRHFVFAFRYCVGSRARTAWVVTTYAGLWCRMGIDNAVAGRSIERGA